MTLISDLRAKLGDYDGKAISILSEADAQFRDQPSYFDSLISLCADEDPLIAQGASWIIKNRLDEGLPLTPKESESYIINLSAHQDWQTQLHLCQSIKHLTIPAKIAEHLLRILIVLRHHKRPFVRAWSLDALVHLSKQHPTYTDRVQAEFRQAQDDPAASVKARARNLQKNLP